jgi:hypothetical protein
VCILTAHGRDGLSILDTMGVCSRSGIGNNLVIEFSRREYGRYSFVFTLLGKRT